MLPLGEGHPPLDSVGVEGVQEMPARSSFDQHQLRQLGSFARARVRVRAGAASETLRKRSLAFESEVAFERQHGHAVRKNRYLADCLEVIR